VEEIGAMATPEVAIVVLLVAAVLFSGPRDEIILNGAVTATEPNNFTPIPPFEPKDAVFDAAAALTAASSFM
jgi:hypothetical protein